ncbi:MAG TPA: HAMP domain-containing sensor histidine kinase [Ktedonobacterales bacterium]
MSMANSGRRMRPARGLTMRRWLALAWLGYALLPGVTLGIVYGLLRVLTGRDISKEPIFGVAITAAVIIQFSVLVVTGVLLGWWVVRPLAAMSAASRRIAADGLMEVNLSLPPSPVREVAEAAAAFGAMGEGLRESLGRQAELEQERRFFVGAVAHDLRTPLFSLRGYLEGLEKGVASSPEKSARYIAVCQQKADELEHLISDLFAYSQLDYLERTPEHETVDLRILLQNAVDGARPQAEAKDISLTVEGASEICEVSSAPHLLARAVGNLLENALRYTPAGGNVTISLHAEESACVLTVADTGSGIASRDLPRIFDPLYRGEASRSRQTGGVGLGLAIARRAFQAHGGELTAANGVTVGAVFTGRLPRISALARAARNEIGTMGTYVAEAETGNYAGIEMRKEVT